MEPAPVVARAAHDPGCYLCPGNARAGGTRNPQYDGTFVFDNDFAALNPEPNIFVSQHELLQGHAERGLCRVVCFSPRHDLTLARMAPAEVRRVVDVRSEQYVGLSARQDVRWVQIFENRGEMMGCSNPHPHGQIWATSELPNEAVKELAIVESRPACVLCEYLSVEGEARERVVSENAGFVALVPFWAVWPFEILVASRRHLPSSDRFTDTERNDFAAILGEVTRKYDGLFNVSFPYTMGLHQLPHDKWHFHAHYYPPLLRSATVRKFMVGYEMLAMPQRDLTAESAAERLRAV